MQQVPAGGKPRTAAQAGGLGAGVPAQRKGFSSGRGFREAPPMRRPLVSITATEVPGDTMGASLISGFPS